MSTLDWAISAIRNSQMLRLCFVAMLAVVLLIPSLLIWGLVSERQERHRAAAAEISSNWGGSQSITGPALVLPYTVISTETTVGGATKVRNDTRHAVFLPRTLKITGRMNVELRHRGIFRVP